MFMYLCFLKFAREGKDAFTSNLRPVAHTMGLQITWPRNHVILCMFIQAPIFPPCQRYGRQISIEAFHDRTGEGSVLRHWHHSAGWIVCLFVCLIFFNQILRFLTKLCLNQNILINEKLNTRKLSAKSCTSYLSLFGMKSSLSYTFH